MVVSRPISRITMVLISRKYSSTFIRKQSIWTQDNTVLSPFKDVDIPNTTVGDHVWGNLHKWADKTAVICGVTKRSYTYHQLYRYSRNFATRLRTQLQIRNGDTVCIMMQNCPDFPLVFLGAIQAGAVVTTVNPIYTAHELSGQLILSNAKVVIGSSETVKTINDAFTITKKELPLIVVKNDTSLPPKAISLQEFIESDNIDDSVLKEASRKSEDVVLLPYSSGTTGLPKGVELSNKNIVANCVQQDIEELKQYNDTTSSHQDSVLAVLPFYHIYGLSIVMLHKLSAGTRLVTLPQFHPSTFLSSLKEQRIDMLYAAPPIVLFLGSHPDVKAEHLESVKKIMCGAAPLHKTDAIKILDRCKNKVDLLQMYGLTEASPLATSMTPGSYKYTSAGFALPNTKLKIISSSDSNSSDTLGSNKVGELLIKGPQVMKGYKDNPEATKEAFTNDGWLKTGDLASIDDDGEVHIADRLKELIKVKGFQVPPAELENLIKSHPHILDAGVIGVPDQRKGEVPKAFVVVKQGHKVDAEDIINFVNEKVAEFKRIKEIVFLESLPKNLSGKLLRRILKEYKA